MKTVVDLILCGLSFIYLSFSLSNSIIRDEARRKTGKASLLNFFILIDLSVTAFIGWLIIVLYS